MKYTYSFRWTICLAIVLSMAACTTLPDSLTPIKEVAYNGSTVYEPQHTVIDPVITSLPHGQALHIAYSGITTLLAFAFNWRKNGYKAAAKTLVSAIERTNASNTKREVTVLSKNNKTANTINKLI